MNRRTLIGAALCLGLIAGTQSAFSADFKPYDPQTFDQAIANGPVVVHVHAEWCADSGALRTAFR